MDMTVEQIIALTAPEFNDLPSETIQMWIEYARPFVSKEQFGNLYNRALASMTCHEMKMAGQGEDPLGDETSALAKSAGYYGLTGISEGSASLSFASAGSTAYAMNVESELAKTRYGSEFVRLKHYTVVPITIRGADNV